MDTCEELVASHARLQKRVLFMMQLNMCYFKVHLPSSGRAPNSQKSSNQILATRCHVGFHVCSSGSNQTSSSTSGSSCTLPVSLAYSSFCSQGSGSLAVGHMKPKLGAITRNKVAILPSCEPYSKLLKGGYIGDYIGTTIGFRV